jgi:hypothetical protein
MGEDKVMSTPEIFKKAFSSFKSRQHKSMVYTRCILDIYMVYTIHIPGLVICKSCQLSKKQWMLEEMEMHVHSMTFQDTNAYAPKSHVLL